MKLLLENNSDLSIIDDQNKTPLDWANFRGDQTLIQLISEKMKIFTPLHKATRNGDIVEVFRLLNDGGNVNCEDPRKWTPLHFASRDIQIEIAKLLIQKGADVNHQSDQEVTPLRVLRTGLRS